VISRNSVKGGCIGGIVRGEICPVKGEGPIAKGRKKRTRERVHGPTELKYLGPPEWTDSGCRGAFRKRKKKKKIYEKEKGLF